MLKADRHAGPKDLPVRQEKLHSAEQDLQNCLSKTEKELDEERDRAAHEKVAILLKVKKVRNHVLPHGPARDKLFTVYTCRSNM